MRESINMKSSLFSLKLFNFLIYGTMVIFTSFFQLYLQDAGMNKFEIGSLLALGPIVSILANPFWRFWSDRILNMRRVLLIMMTGTLVMVQLLFHSDTYAMVYISMILFFFFQSPVFSHSNSLILGYIEDTGYKFGSFRLWGSMGWAIIAIATGLVLDWTGVAKVSILFTVVLVLAIGVLLFLPKLLKPSESPTIYIRGFANILGNRYFLSFIVLGIIVSIPNAMNNTFMSLYITELGGSKRMVGLAVFLSSFFEIGVFLLFDRYLNRKISWLVGCLALVSLLFGFRWMLMADATLPIQVALIQVLHCITFGGYFYVGTQLSLLLVPRPYRATGQAVYTLTWSGLAGVIGGFVGGWLYQSFGAEAMYSTGTSFAFVGALGFGWMWYVIKRHGYKPIIPKVEEPLEDWDNSDED
ncbi:MFS transporter [Paenibacillus sp. IHBB 10380]|nr:MFS transporter [Paenibacillus sp. IHBB 10380]